MNKNYLHTNVTNLILKGYYRIYNNLGYGFLEKVYENAMLIELSKLGLGCEPQKQIEVFYDGLNVGTYFADIVVDDVVIIELKAVESIGNIHEEQLVNYLRATKVEVGLLLNFGKEPQHKKRVLTNDYKRGIRH